MATVKRITDLTDYTNVLPYASEMFGIYQPLLGWKSIRIKKRFDEGYMTEKPFIIDRLKNVFAGLADVVYKPDRRVEINLRPGALDAGKFRSYDSVVLEHIAAKLPPYDEYKPTVWSKVITPDFVEALLKKDVTKIYTDLYPEVLSGAASLSGAALSRAAAASGGLNEAGVLAAYERQIQYESSIAGALLYLVKEKSHGALEEIFYASKHNSAEAERLIRMLAAENGAEAYLDIENLDPGQKEHIAAVALSPISVVHLFRQYFFELDTFLGTPVSHVWLSPGSSVELIEVHTRRTVVEKTLETTLDILTQSETTVTERDEISDAVKENNQQDVKFGASVKASYASIEATSSFDYNRSQEQARETTHKRMREQTEKLSSEIRKNFKSTFKTVTEFTDQSSSKHTLANTTEELINYELRRKMRQVGVQVQDIGTFLCWQTYVDDPGKEIGLAKLIHIAKPPELGGIPHPEEIPTLQPFHEDKIATIPFVSVEGGADKEGEVYIDGVEADDSEWFGELEKIQADFNQEFVSPKSGYVLANVEFDPQGNPVQVSRKGGITNSGGKASFVLHLDSADFQGQNSIQIKLTLHWSPAAGANDAIIQKNKDNIAAFKEKEKAEYEKAYVENVKDRVTKASKIRPRDSAELREEERIVVYRRLIQDMLMHGITLPDDRTRHVVAELINSMFDVDKMLYFVAPEWWRPRLHRSKQQLGEKPPVPKRPNFSTASAGVSLSAAQKGLAQKIGSASSNAAAVSANVMSANVVGWGGINDTVRDNYYITDESEPAKLGSSLGWLMQLDGDNMRNAFLNAPWVKAVIPIRPGREEAAINWLKGVEGMNGITDDVVYHASNPNEKDINGNPLDGQKMINVLLDLAKKIKKKYQEGIETGKYPKQDEVSDPALVDPDSVVTSTPIDRVYEHGFFPLEGSFRLNVGKNYEIFDQWIEILPTDQIVPVEVKYDPKTGRQI